jgi:16S rRNA (guanine527-N7)-methyltransferase
MDLGAGGGVPGLVLALDWPETSWVLLDSAERRVAFLEDAIVSLGLGARVRAVLARAEDAARGMIQRESVELVVARAFGPPAVTAECASPFIARGGRLVVSEPPGTLEPARWPAAPLLDLGFVARAAEVDGRSFVVLDKVAPCPVTVPRRVGLAARRPWF